MSHRRLEGMDKSLSATAPFDSARKGTYPHPSTISESERKEKKQAAPSVKRARPSIRDTIRSETPAKVKAIELNFL